jgi:hypothetical protein
MVFRHLLSIKDFIFESVLNEVGEANIHDLKWELAYDNGKEAMYNFYKDTDIYELHINRKSESSIVFYFSCNGDRDNSTNSGNPLSVMGAVISILKDYLNNNPEVNKFSFVPSSEYYEDDRRFNIYMRYIKKNFPGSRISIDYLPNGYKGVDVIFK